jgi:hypothetical protein
MPFKAKLVGVGASARASGGTSPTLTVDVKAGGTTLLSAPISVTAATYTEGTITTSAIADEAAITVDSHDHGHVAHVERHDGDPHFVVRT